MPFKPAIMRIAAWSHPERRNGITIESTALLTPQPKTMAATERKERREGAVSLCALCVLWRQKFAQENKISTESNTDRHGFLFPLSVRIRTTICESLLRPRKFSGARTSVRFNVLKCQRLQTLRTSLPFRELKRTEVRAPFGCGSATL